MRRILTLATALIAALLGLAAPAAAAPPPPVDAGGLHVVSYTQRDARLLEFAVSTPALPASTSVRVLLPTSYDASPTTRYPVVYLLHGGYASYTSWTTVGNAVSASAGRNVIIVMPDAKNSWYSDFYNDGAYGQPQYERYHISQLIPFVDANYRTVTSRSGRFIAGLSMGGFGAMSYAARHPDLFSAAGSFSGAVDTNYPACIPVVENSGSSMGYARGAIWGLRTGNEARWQQHNPYDQASHLSGLRLSIYSGDGNPGPLDPSGMPFDQGEADVHAMSMNLHTRLTQLGIGHTWVSYAGTHTHPYFNRDFAQWLPTVA